MEQNTELDKTFPIELLMFTNSLALAYLKKNNMPFENYSYLWSLDFHMPKFISSLCSLLKMERQMSMNSSIMGMQSPNLSNPCASPQVAPMHSEAKMVRCWTLTYIVLFSHHFLPRTLGIGCLAIKLCWNIENWIRKIFNGSKAT